VIIHRRYASVFFAFGGKIEKKKKKKPPESIFCPEQK